MWPWTKAKEKELKTMRDRIRARSNSNPEKIYIVPTRAGGFFLFTTLVMLLIGSGYSNNLVNLLAFFMFSLVFVSMVMTQLQLKGVLVESAAIAPAFASSPSEHSAYLKNSNSAERWGIEMGFAQFKDGSGPKHLKSLQTNRVTWQQPMGKRGKFETKRFELYSVFPLGLFYAWKVVDLPTTYWIYPELKGSLPMPQEMSAVAAEGQRKNPIGTGDDFRGHRKFQKGDSSRQVDWKAHARGRPLLIKELNEGDPPDQIFDWRALDGTGLTDEDRLSQIAAWVQEAYTREMNFTLRLPGQPDRSGKGYEHATRCFQSLATWGMPS
ncbi:MAG: DUF58 domain-containing protein [Bdellovibrionales bacterium]|nr:DUF58 domain-containing protein [Bdellovibrionales bacterium]